MADLWPALRSGDVLAAEVATARCLGAGQMLGLEEDRSDSIFVKMATQSRKPEDAALLRIIASLGSPAVKRSASRALGELTADGIYPADWVAEVGRAVPVQAWRRFDAFGDEEAIAVTYRYGEPSAQPSAEHRSGGEHAFLVHIGLSGLPVINTITLVTGPADVADLADKLKLPSSGFTGCAEITLAEARRHLEAALTYTTPNPDEAHEVATYLPVIRSRLRRLPPPADGRSYTADDRAAAVDTFMKSQEAADAVAADEESTRFWAEVLTVYSSRRSGEPPAEVGPAKLRLMLSGFVPHTYALIGAQRRHAQPAVTAWVRWSAASRGLDEAATRELTSAIPAALDDFDAAYDDPAAAADRGYTADVAVREADVQRIGEHMLRRHLAMPPPAERDHDEDLDAADPASRQAYAEAEFGDCGLPEGMTRDDFMAAVQRVIEELWTGEPRGTWERAQRLLATSMDPHDVIHDLVDAGRR